MSTCSDAASGVDGSGTCSDAAASVDGSGLGLDQDLGVGVDLDLGVGLVVSGLHKSFGTQPVLAGVDLEVPPGSLIAILGQSGSGKTTLLRVLAGFEPADAGRVEIGGQLVDGPGRHVPPEQRRVGFVPQEGALFPHLTVAANVGFGLRRSQRRRRVGELLDLTGLAGLAGRYPHELSGGQQQRVALARALSTRPGVVLLDEPFSSLDPALRSSVRTDVVRLLAETGTTALLVTHDQDEALSTADQVAVLRDGRIVQAGSPHEVYTRPADVALARFVGEANVVNGTMRAGRAETPFGSLPLVDGCPAPPDGAGVMVLVRPEQVVLVGPERGAPGGPERVGLAGPAQVTLAGVVVERSYHGHDSVVAVDTGGRAGPSLVAVRCSGPGSPAVGERVGLRVAGQVTVWPDEVAPAGSVPGR